jgi:hypothetical protein
VSRLESTASAPPEQQAFVTREVLDDKLGRIEAALKTLMGKQDAEHRNKRVGEQSSPPETVVGGQSQETPLEREASRPTRGCSYKEFAACKPPTFNGERNPVVAMRWVMEMETAFDTCKCSNDDKVVYARSMLKADATYWWEMESGGKPSEMAKSTTWEKFVARFKARFCPMSATRKLEEEFLRLEQGNMTVQEYTTKFMEKARFAEIYVPTEERRIEKYVWGLKGNIREFVMTRNPMTFEAAIDMA